MNIRIVSPAGFCDSEVIDAGVSTLKSWGHNVTVGRFAKGKYGRFAGTPEERSRDIIEALEDDSVDILYCSRGGYGCVQIIDSIPISLIAEKKKPIFGYSDITALHSLWQKAGVRSVHAHMMKHLGQNPEHETSLAIKSLLESYNKDNSSLTNTLQFDKYGISAPIIGGNLAVLSGLHGTQYDFNYEGKILFIEDIGESPYKIDRMINQLRLGGVFEKIKGLVLGQFTGCDEDPEMPKPLVNTILDTVDQYNLPVIISAPIGHVDNNFPIVEGAEFHI